MLSPTLLICRDISHIIVKRKYVILRHATAALFAFEAQKLIVTACRCRRSKQWIHWLLSRENVLFLFWYFCQQHNERLFWHNHDTQPQQNMNNVARHFIRVPAPYNRRIHACSDIRDNEWFWIRRAHVLARAFSQYMKREIDNAKTRRPIWLISLHEICRQNITQNHQRRAPHEKREYAINQRDTQETDVPAASQRRTWQQAEDGVVRQHTVICAHHTTDAKKRALIRAIIPRHARYAIVFADIIYMRIYYEDIWISVNAAHQPRKPIRRTYTRRAFCDIIGFVTARRFRCR